jgi:hypothetical protein
MGLGGGVILGCRLNPVRDVTGTCQMTERRLMHHSDAESGTDAVPRLGLASRSRSVRWRTAALWVIWSTLFMTAVRGQEPKAVDPSHPLAQPLQHAYDARLALDGLTDYEATFMKQEMIGRRLNKSVMRLKFRQEPYSVYMLFDAPHKGREVIYVAGLNNGQLLAHETGLKALAGTVQLAIDSPTAMEGNRHPITMVGLRNLIDRVIEQWELEAQYGEVDVQYRPKNRIGENIECKVIESSHPRPRKQFKFHLTRLFIETATGYPIRVEQYGFPQEGQEPPLLEEYTYYKLQANPGLTNADFDAKNPKYKFPR